MYYGVTIGLYKLSSSDTNAARLFFPNLRWQMIRKSFRRGSS